MSRADSMRQTAWSVRSVTPGAWRRRRRPRRRPPSAGATCARFARGARGSSCAARPWDRWPRGRRALLSAFHGGPYDGSETTLVSAELAFCGWWGVPREVRPAGEAPPDRLCSLARDLGHVCRVLPSGSNARRAQLQVRRRALPRKPFPGASHVPVRPRQQWQSLPARAGRLRGAGHEHARTSR